MSTNIFLAALVVNGAIAFTEISAFTFARRYFRLIYEPRSFSVLEARRQRPLSPHLFGWPISLYKADYHKIKDINGLDSYFFVRFLRMMARTMFPIWVLSWAILLPLTSVNTNVSGHSGLDVFIFGNIAPTKQDRYAAHVLLTWVFTVWICWNIKYEMRHYIRVRQHYLVSPAHSSTAQACTILVTGIPPKYLSESALTRLFNHLPGGVRKIWMNRNLGDMPQLYNRRLTVCRMLESAETSLLNKAIKRHGKKQKKIAKSSNKGINFTPAIDPEVAAKALVEELVPRKERPSHRLPLFTWLPFSIPLVGKKVDTIEWARDQVHELNTQLGQRREILARDIERTTVQEAQTIDHMADQTYPPTNGAFILFNKQIAAHMAVHALTHHRPYCMSSSQKYVEVAREDVIWDNLVVNPYKRRIRLALSWVATFVFSIVWAFPVAIIGGLFGTEFHNLLASFANAIQGIFPVVSLNLLFVLVPIVLRRLARLEGIPQKTGVELSVMDRFFLFQVFNGFLFFILSPSLFEVVKDPKSVPTILAQNLPKFSTFFLTFVSLQGLSGAAGGFLQTWSLVVYYFKITLLRSTPRSIHVIKYSPRTSQWGTLFPNMTLLVVITLSYSIISPIINGLAFGAFFLFYVLYKYIFIWVNDQPYSSETGGLFFPKAIQHIFVGLYVQQLCLCALFWTVHTGDADPNRITNKHGAIPEGALVFVLIVFTAFFQNTILNSYGPLIKSLPLSLVDESCSRRVGVESEDTAVADAPPPAPSLPEDIVVTESSNAHRHSGDAGPQRPDDADVERALLPSFTNESRPSSPSPYAKPMEMEGLTDFSHPAAVDKQRVIWLPKDRLGLVHDIEQELDSRDILHSTEGAEVDDKGHVDVTWVAQGNRPGCTCCAVLSLILIFTLPIFVFVLQLSVAKAEAV